MKTFMAGAIVAIVIGTTGTAHAQVQKIVSPPFPTDVGTDGACYVRNTGTTAISVDVTIHSNNGVVVFFSNCDDGPLAGGRTCVVLAGLPDSSYAACNATAESVGKLRGTFEVRETPSIVNPALRVLVAGDLVKK
jgi:hypothetical protein